jgi:hypothetical protein
MNLRDASASKKATAGLMKIVQIQIGKIAPGQLVQQSTLAGWGNPRPRKKRFKGAS